MTSAPGSGSSTTCSSSSRHGAFDLKLAVTGDLDVDAHHTVEDTGIGLGDAVLRALGTKRGINRAGYFVMPMDETLAVAAIDFSGRPFCVIDLPVKAAKVGDLPTELVQDFFEGFRGGGARERAPEGDAWTIESSPDRGGVQGVCRALRVACARDRRWRACCRPRKGCCSDGGARCRLWRRQSGVGDEGPARRWRVSRDRRRRRGDCAVRRHRHSRRRALFTDGVHRRPRARRDWHRHRRRRAGARHLPWPAVAVRRQRRSR